MQVKGAITKAGMKSATLIPNFHPTTPINGRTQNINLIDMAGYKDKGRTYVGVFGVSYMLKTMLEKATNVKFVLVLSENKLLSEP